MAKSKPERQSRRIVRVEEGDDVKDKNNKPKAPRYSSYKADPKQERVIHGLKIGDEFGGSERRPQQKGPRQFLPLSTESRTPVVKGPAAPTPKAVEPQPISQKVTVFTPGSKEGLAAKGQAAVEELARNRPATKNEVESIPSPFVAKGQEDVKDSGLPSDWNKSASNVFGGAGLAGDPQTWRPQGKNDPILSTPELFKAPQLHNLASPGAGGLKSVAERRAQHVNDFVAAAVRGRRSAMEAHRAAYHAVAPGTRRASGETGLCGTAGCTRTTEGPEEKEHVHNIIGAATHPVSRLREEMSLKPKTATSVASPSFTDTAK